MKLNHQMCDFQFSELPIEEKRYIIAIIAELESAKEKHPTWPDDLIHRAAIVGEEAGELLQAALQYTYEKGRFYNMHKEAIQTGATVLRFLVETGELPEHKDKA